MPRTAPIGREEELGSLVDAARAAAGGVGQVVFLDGPTGSGKSFLLKALGEELAGDDGPDVVSVLCYETSAGNPLGPFGEVLRALTSRERRGDRAKRALEVVGQVAPPIVELIPVIGKLAALGVKTAADLGVYALGGSHEAQQTELAVDVALALSGIAGDTPLVVVVDDAQWMDAASTEVVARLAQAPEEHPLLLVVAYDGNLVPDTHPLARAKAATAGRSGVRTLRLGALDEEGIAAFLAERYGSNPNERLAAWLHDRTGGSPLFLSRFLDTLEGQGVLRQEAGAWTLDGMIAGGPGDWRLGGELAGAETPGTLLELLRPRVADLADDERVLLETGAVQGRRFLSTVLVKLLAQEEDAVLDRLAQIADRRRLIASEAIEDWWSDRSALYAFDPGVLQEILYGRYAKSPYERKRRHKAVAEALEALVEGDDPPPRHALLEIARHYEQAGTPVAAATRLVEVAESTFAEGADSETAEHADRAVDLLREAGAAALEAPEGQRLLAQAILLLLLGGEAVWSAEPGEGTEERIVALAEEAERAAEAAGDPRLRANARYAKARAFTAYRGLGEAIAAYREALELARAAGDPVAEFAILSDYGHHMDSVDLAQGSKLLQEAHALLTGDALQGQLGDAQHEAELATLESSIGVAAFDLGRYGEALGLLTQSTEVLGAAHRRDQAAWARSFLGQVQTAIGLYETAETTLGEGIELLADFPGPLGVRGYLRALLGRLYVEWEPPRLAEARETIAKAREETKASGIRSVVPLVEGFWAELLLAEGTPEALAEARDVLGAASSYGWARSDIAICSLLARVALAEGRAADAVEPSTKAVTELAERGGAVPTVRSEEILWTHARVLEATGSADAADYRAQAAAVVRAKAGSLTDDAQRESFLTRVRLSRDILAAGD